MASNYDPGYIEHLYDQNPEKEWQRLVQSASGEIKLYIHNHYLRTHLAAGMRVLDIGAGPGRFTQLLHEIGCKVVVGDISLGNTGNLTRDMDPSSQHFCHMYRADELRSLLESDGFKVVAMSASDSLSATYGESLAGIREDQALWAALLELELETSASSGYLEAGTHLLAVAKKVRDLSGITKA